MLFSRRLDYPGIGPEHSHLMDSGRAEYFAATDKQALDAFQLVSRLEGIIPALETSHAFAYLEVSLGFLLAKFKHQGQIEKPLAPTAAKRSYNTSNVK